MFRATLCPSSGETTLFMRQLVLVILYGWLSGMQEHMFLHTNCFSWWWAHSRPKRVQKINKCTKKNCAPSWLYLQGYTGMHGQQNIKYTINTRWLKSVLKVTWISMCTTVRIVFQMLPQANWTLSLNWMSGRKCSRACIRTLEWSCGQWLYILQAILTKTFTVQNIPYLCPSCKSRPGNFCVYMYLCFPALLP